MDVNKEGIHVKMVIEILKVILKLEFEKISIGF